MTSNTFIVQYAANGFSSQNGFTPNFEKIDNKAFKFGAKFGVGLVNYTFGLAKFGVSIGGAVFTGFKKVGGKISGKNIDVGWDFAFRMVDPPPFMNFALGLGSYNKYNMWGMKLGTGPEKAVRIDPEDALLGIRIGIGKKKPVQFIEFGQSIRMNSWRRSYHMHFNFVRKKRPKNSRSKQDKGPVGDGVIDFRYR